MTKEELEKATGQELIDERNYCGVDGYYGDYLDNLNAEMLKRFNLLAELEAQIEKMKCCYNCSKWNEGLLLCNDPTVRVTTYADYCCEDWEMIEK